MAARHLHHFGYSVQVVYPKPTAKPLYEGLVLQARALGLPLRAWTDVQVRPRCMRAAWRGLCRRGW